MFLNTVKNFNPPEFMKKEDKSGQKEEIGKEAISKSDFRPGDWGKNLRKKKRRSVSEYVEGIKNGNRILLGQAITLIESTKVSDQSLAQEIIEACLPHAHQSFRIGITGTPGVGKSTFIEALGLHICKNDHRLAVMAIDPTSQRTKGSILGDKTRMGQLSIHESAFIRPSPAGDSLGGVARKTRETIILCEAAGYDTILIETVGVGQSETAVHSMVDFFLLLILPGAGDELQGIKRGIVEMADLIAVNKADEDRMTLAKRAKQEYRNALHLFPPTESGWIPSVVTSSGLNNIGIKEIWEQSQDYKRMVQRNKYFDQKRLRQAKYWLYETIQNGIREKLERDESLKKRLKEIEKEILNGQRTSFQGAKEILSMLFKS